eukprot:1013562-Alexandrium_andersonii.AAC.1
MAAVKMVGASITYRRDEIHWEFEACESGGEWIGAVMTANAAERTKVFVYNTARLPSHPFTQAVAQLWN